MLRTSEFILNFVLNSCWQIAVIVALAALASRLLKNGPARYRHTLDLRPRGLSGRAISNCNPLHPLAGYPSQYRAR